MASVVVIGAGAMGLAAGYYALKRGHRVTVLEAAPEAGGMAAHFDLGGLSIERFYHFVCKADRPTFELLDELGLGERMRWVVTSMGYYIDGRLEPWGDPLSLLRFPKLSFVEKLRYGAMMAAGVRRRDAGSLEQVSAKDWITRWCGARVYERLWAPLFKLKFYQYADNISAAWIWTRIKRIGTSRRSMFQEELGYIEGGSETLIHALVDAIRKRGGEVRLGTAASRVAVEGGRVTGVIAGEEIFPADAVISTVPTPLVERLVPDLPAADLARYRAIVNIGVVCVVFRLKRSVSPNFWINISDERFEIPGIVEFSNLRPTGDTVVYVPYYMPVSHPKFARSDALFRAEAFGYLKLINPALGEGDVIACHVGRLRHAQPVCPPGFAAMLPPIESAIAGLQIADTCFYYPEDRGIAESVRLGKAMVERIAA
ncbi:MAG: NAD(P)/FAD-dependent oxidoreductase [Hyphomicrobiales bacterium]|nr:NAD(P)/FAD-dependent oxidoreductase [Hyphomicrobiales bacterium]MBV8826208.1 NAD(P)/FAD-dependent oxidoreductase [Hyphomicrobiales bacterium]MBV9427626.1 NAD(P)/FAD-dependent oxidoreductase [Bradyrhizobiaceae bacterium]